MPRAVLYPAVQQPLPVAAPAVAPEQWYPVYPDRTLPKARPAAVGFIVSDPTPVVTVAPAVPPVPESFSPVITFRQSVVYPALQQPTPLDMAAPAVAPDQWYPIFPSRIPQRPRPAAIGLIITDPTPRLVPGGAGGEDWQPLYRPRRGQPLTEVFAPVFVPGAPPETITLDKWIGNYPHQIARKRPATDTTPFYVGQPITPPAETVTLDKWLPNYPHQLHRKRSNIPGEPFYVGEPITPAVVAPDQWYPNYPVQIVRVRVAGQPQIVLVPVVTGVELGTRLAIMVRGGHGDGYTRRAGKT